ncbi:MAG: aminomethyl-transferring glycine dehydrogenase subunit GcvPA [Planctomycetota bacterium]|jgi:glycine dehydrogenase subunit 1|nr:aminomethyl-transferring glycine dehydrogenase subunit GcvPA [Planctomycetota bacterium]
MNLRYFPHTGDDIGEMLETIGVESIDDLFSAVPAHCRMDRAPGAPTALSEWDLSRRIEEMARTAGGDWKAFVGAGSQPHHIPAVVPALAGRSEFLTSYTPYQPEMGQGTLQAIFEFQTLIARLVGLEVANASMYDGATAMAESALMAQRATKRRNIVVSSLVHPHWRQVLETYLAPADDVAVAALPALPDGRTDLSALGCAADPAALVMQSPNFFGVVEDLGKAADAIHDAGGLFAAGFSEPFAYGILKTPGELGADIVFGDGQSLGQAQSFGGPGLGIMATKMEFVRQMPGRLVGETVDNRGQRGFVLTLSTREQHIRRAKAVSNICSNAGHSALTAAIFMAAAGRTGFRKLSRINRDLAEHLKKGLLRKGFTELFSAPTYNEFVLAAPDGFAAVHEALCRKRVLLGLPLEKYYPERAGAWLFGVTETTGKDEIDAILGEITL